MVRVGPNGRSPVHLRMYHGMAYDPVRGVTVLFGGFNGNGGTENGETWEWNGSSWTQRNVPGPSPRTSFAMDYDFTRHVTILFGGQRGAVWNGDTWEWDGTTWTQH